MKHIAVYIRVSSKAQDTASQELDLQRWLIAQNSALPVTWYRDNFTGKTMERPGMSKLAETIGRGEVASVVCWRLDRLGRTAKGLTAFFEDLQRAKVNLVSLKDGLDLSTPAGRLMANVLASVAAFETEIRAERVRAGQIAARAAGKTWGGSKRGRLLKVTWEQLVLIRSMQERGCGATVIARATGLSRPTIYRQFSQFKSPANQ